MAGEFYHGRAHADAAPDRRRGAGTLRLVPPAAQKTRRMKHLR